MEIGHTPGYWPISLRVEYYSQLCQNQTSEVMLLSEGHRQFKHVGNLLVLRMGRESRTLVGENEKEKKNGRKVFITINLGVTEFITANFLR